MSVDARPASAPSAPHEIQPMSQDAEPNAGPDARQMSQLTQSPSGREQRAWISESEWTGYINDVRDVSPRPCSHSIFRVPEFLKNTKREAYVPQRVSLGPYHHRIVKLSQMGLYKGRVLHGMMVQYNTDILKLQYDTENIDMRFAIRARDQILQMEKKIRDSYEETIDCDEETLARMLCLDGCFLLEVLTIMCGDKSLDCFSHSTLGNKGNKVIVFSSTDIVNDVLMLENQVPFIVLRKLLQLELNKPFVQLELNTPVHAMLLNMVMSCIWRLLKPCYTSHLEKWCSEKLAGEEKIQHLLGFLYEAIVHPAVPIEDTDRGTVCSICIDCSGRCIRQHQGGLNAAPNQFQRIPSAVELRNAGIKFKPFHGGIKEIKFDPESATIFLPPICITDCTEVLFRNLIAFEVCRPSEFTYVSCYVDIMDNLIDSRKDNVALLRRMGVLTSRLGKDNEVVDLFNGLRKATGPASLFNVFQPLTEVNAYYENEIRVQLQIPKLVQDYCSTPWKALASTAAIVLLLLTLVQTIFSVISVYKK